MIRELSKLLHEHMNYPLFGILLFSEAHPYIIKTLKDTDYYNALDKITGKDIVLFTTMLFPVEYKKPGYIGPNAMPMRPVWKEPEQNKKVLPWFNIKDSRELPLLVIFGHQSGDFYYQKYSLKADSEQEVFNRLNEVLSRISVSVQKAKDKNGVSKEKLFEYAQWEMKKLETHQKIKDFFETVSMLRGAVGI